MGAGPPACGWVLRCLSALISSLGLFYLIKQKAPEIESFPWLAGQALRCTSPKLSALPLCLKYINIYPSDSGGLYMGAVDALSPRDEGLSWKQAQLLQRPEPLPCWPWELSVSSCRDVGREGGGSRLLRACNEANPQNFRAFSQVEVVVGGAAAAEEGGLADDR